MKKDVIYKFFIFIICLALGYFLPSQLRYDLEENSFVSLNSIVELKKQVNNTKNQIKIINESIESKKNSLIKIEAATSEGKVSELLEEEIKNMRNIAGFEDVWGPGVYIFVADSEETDNSQYSQEYYDIVHDIYLSNFVNELKNNGAEAISINGQRIVSTSEINCGGPVIKINNRSITNPFVIKAIGDPQKLYTAISGSKGYGTYLRDYFNLKIKTQISDNVYISKYDSKIQFKYARKIGEGE